MIDQLGLGYQPTLFDRLVVFQSAPLAYKNLKNNSLDCVEPIDLEKDENMINDALKDAEATGAVIIDVIFEFVTRDIMRYFFTSGGITSVVHFSGHGHQDYLVLEDGKEGVDFLKVDELPGLTLLNACKKFDDGKISIRC